MRTIGRHWPKDALGDYVWPCDYCGVKWRRSKLRRDRSGLLACPDDVGADRVPFARPPHVQNNWGTGGTSPAEIAAALAAARAAAAETDEEEAALL